MTDNNITSGKKWRRPTIKPLVLLGECAYPTSTSASSPEKQTPRIAELLRLVRKDISDRS